MEADVGAQPLPSSGNLVGFLHIALKTDLELSAGDEAQQAAIERFKGIRTRGEARAYAEQVYAKAQAARAQRATKKPAARLST
jgi:phospholipase C